MSDVTVQLRQDLSRVRRERDAIELERRPAATPRPVKPPPDPPPALPGPPEPRYG